MLFIIFVITVSLPIILCRLDEIEALVKATKVATEYVLRPVGWLVDEITWILDAQAICRFEDLLEGEIPLGDLEDEDIFPGQESPEIQHIFTVDAIHGPALWLKPRYTTVEAGKIVTLSVMAEDVGSLMLVHLEIEFNASNLSWLDPEEGSFFATYDVFLHKVDQIDGRGIVDLGVVGGTAHDVDGSGTLATLHFRVKPQAVRGTVRVALGDSVQALDSMTRPLMLTAREASMVVIE